MVTSYVYFLSLYSKQLLNIYSIETLESWRIRRVRHWPNSGDHPVPVGDDPLLDELPRGPRDLKERDAQQQPHVAWAN